MVTARWSFPRETCYLLEAASPIQKTPNTASSITSSKNCSSGTRYLFPNLGVEVLGIGMASHSCERPCGDWGVLGD